MQAHTHTDPTQVSIRHGAEKNCFNDYSLFKEPFLVRVLA